MKKNEKGKNRRDNEEKRNTLEFFYEETREEK